MGSLDYKEAGVDLEAGYDVVKRIKKHVQSTARLGLMGNIGAFGGMFDLSALNVKEPVLVSGTDGVGTKLKIAFEMDKHDSIGVDLVAMCVNDILAQGAEPLYFLDYIAQGKTYPERVEQIVSGIAEGCRQSGCALVGGETAEMPGMYADGEYDVAGYTTGVVEKSKLIDGSKVQVGDILLAIPSTGVHSNGFSLVRKIIKEQGLSLGKVYSELDDSISLDGDPKKKRVKGARLGDVLLTPTRIYVQAVLDLLENCPIHGLAHITGGGFDENIPRILKEDQSASIDEGTWEILPIFKFLEKKGEIAHREMFNIFNMGVGMLVALAPEDAERAIDLLAKHGEKATIIGKVVSGNHSVIINKI